MIDGLSEHVDDIFLEKRKAAYDAAAKAILSERIILAWILKYCVEEFKDCEISDIAEKYIGEDIEVSQIPIEPDKTNAVKKIIGENVEYKTLTEGTTTFDIRFSAYAPTTGNKIKLIINIEAQKKHNPGYSLIKRAIFHCSRLLSSQYNVEFTEPKFDEIKKVYLIWLCMSSPESKISAVTQYLMKEKNLIGNIRDKGKNYDLLQVIMIYIGSDEKKIKNKLLKLLHLIFRANLKAIDKKEQLREEYNIEWKNNWAKEMNIMCNLGEGIFEDGIAQGMSQGIAQGISQGIAQGIEQGLLQGKEENMLNNLRSLIKNTNFTITQAMDVLEVPQEERDKYMDLL